MKSRYTPKQINHIIDKLTQLNTSQAFREGVLAYLDKGLSINPWPQTLPTMNNRLNWKKGHHEAQMVDLYPLYRIQLGIKL